LSKPLIILSLSLLLAACHRNITNVEVTADFTYEVLDNDYSVPVRIAFENTSKNALAFKWSFEGGSPESYDKKDPGYIEFSKPGTIKIKLEAWNDEEHKEKEITIDLDSLVTAGFDIQPIVNNYGPTQFTIINRSVGVNTYNWSFENGAPASSVEKNPTVQYSAPGQYEIKLQAANSRGEKQTISKKVIVLPGLEKAEFNIVPSFDDEDYEAPLTATLQNQTTSATTHKWTATGGALSNATDSIATISFTNPGTYTITYEASNGKETKTATQTITVKPNSQLRSFTNVHLGINTAHAIIGSFFSTKLRKVIKKAEVTATNGPAIDIAYFGLSESFSYNLFISPDATQSLTFGATPGATHTQLVNLQEVCSCSSTLTPAAFDAVTNGAAFGTISYTETAVANNPFSISVLPRVILFQNASGKKGAIKVKQMVQAGQQSYIVCDIKVQKD
jgi:surface-anchored protein